jgi:type IV pilus assembly protein PilB
MGIEPYLVASSLECVIGQRLVRRLCTDCRRAVTVPGVDVGLEGSLVDIYEAVGCPRCGDSGYRGRLGLYEVMCVSDAIRTQIVRHATTSEITATALEEGMTTLRDDGLAKVRAGRTSLAEIARVVS